MRDNMHLDKNIGLPTSHGQFLLASYIEQGFAVTPIPYAKKAPVHYGWNDKGNQLTAFNQLPDNYNMGLCHAYSGTMALDIDNIEYSFVELFAYGIDLFALMNAPDAVKINSGRANHGKLIYRTPFGIPLKSLKLIATDSQGKKFNYLDFRCATAEGSTLQDVLPPSIHPDTMQPYTWSGDFTKIPQIPQALLEFWLNRLQQESTAQSVNVSNFDSNWDEIRSALQFISPDISRDEWVSVGMAIHDAGVKLQQMDEAFSLWDEWSQGSDKYKGERDLMNAWRSFRPNAGIGAGSLFFMAIENGWQKPTPPVEELFADVQITTALPESAPAWLKPAETVVPDWLKPAEAVVPDWLKPAESVVPNWLKPAEHKVEMPAWLCEKDEGDDEESVMKINPLVGIDQILSAPQPDIDLNLFPEILRRRAQEVSESIGSDPLVPLFAGMVTVCGAVDSRTRLELVHGFQVPPVLWAMTIGDPADKKSPASTPMLKVLHEIEKTDIEPFKKRQLEFEGKRAKHEAEYKAFIEWSKDPLNAVKGEVPPSVSELPPEPKPLRMVVSDITSQKLVRVCADQPRGLACWLDEMAHWVNKMTDSRSGEDRSAWVQSYESRPYIMDRVGAGELRADNMAVSIYGNIQPNVFREGVNGMAKDGMLQRFLPICLRPHMTRLGKPLTAFETNEKEYNEMINVIYSLPPRTYGLSPDAYDYFRDFQVWYEEAKWDERLNQSGDTFMTAFGKLEGMVGRFALILHLMKRPYEMLVDLDTMVEAVGIVRGFVIPSMRYAYGNIANAMADSISKPVANYILVNAGEVEDIHLRDIKRDMKHKFDKDDSDIVKNRRIMSAMDELEACGWVVQTQIDFKGQQVTATWKVNPMLANLYAEQKKQVIDAKLRIRKGMYESFNVRREKRFAKEKAVEKMRKKQGFK